MKYFITGAQGQLGYDIIRELNKRGITNDQIVAPTLEQMDLTDRAKVLEILSEVKPDIIFHCAAWTNVDGAEDNEELVTKINVEGTKNIVDGAKINDSKVIYISTDYVFDGTKDKLQVYETNDIPNPQSVYGKTKYLGEVETLKYNKSFVVRISWVFGINGNNFINKMLELSQTRTELNIVADQIGSPTYTVDLSKLLVDMSNSDKYGIYHATNEGFCSWADFARYAFEINNVATKVNNLNTSEYPTKATRPLNSQLNKSKLVENGFDRLPSWKNAVDRYNEELQKVKKIGSR